MSFAPFEPITGVEDIPDGLEGDIVKDDLKKSISVIHDVQSPRAVTNVKINHRQRFVGILLVGILLVGIILIFTEQGEEGIGPTHVNLEASVGGAWPHRTYHYGGSDAESDDEVDCCHIYSRVAKDYTISARRIVQRDISGSNCPSLSTLVSNYNDYHIRYYGRLNCSATNCCSIDIFRDELIRFNRTVEDHLIPIEISKDDTCPTIKTLITKYENYYAQDDTTIIIIFICILLCWVCSKSR